MRKHLTDGELRAALDGELGAEQLRRFRKRLPAPTAWTFVDWWKR